MPKLFIDEFVGVSNRFETLPLAFAIRQHYGHDIVLDWQELDSFSVADTQRGKVRLLARIGARRIRQCDRAVFDGLAGQKIILRSLDGPEEILAPIYLEVARKIRLLPALADSIRQTFRSVANKPVVGVHIRQGDYVASDDTIYQLDREWPAVSSWWYAQTMRDIARQMPDVHFFISTTGDPNRFGQLFEGLNTFSLSAASPYGYKGSGHGSAVNPVADIFALACCSVILATPLSGYSHWAANVLGPPSDCIVPLPGATSSHSRRGLVRLHGSRLPRWRKAGRSGSDTYQLHDNWSDIVFDRAADVAWL